MRVSRRAVIAIASIAWFAAVGYGIYAVVFAPFDDPAYLCAEPVEYPAASVSAETVLRECAAGNTYTIHRGDTIGVDLESFSGVDTSRQWSALSVSDGYVLSTVRAPSRVIQCSSMPCPSGFSPQRTDEVAVYAAAHTGRATISAFEQHCGGNRGGCDKGYLWHVTIRVD